MSQKVSNLIIYVTVDKNGISNSRDCIVKHRRDTTILGSAFETSKRRKMRTQFRNNFFSQARYLPYNVISNTKSSYNISLYFHILFSFISLASFRRALKCVQTGENEREDKEKKQVSQSQGVRKSCLKR
jgi:hypothetical protein